MAIVHPGQNPWLDPAYGVEMSERERKELMTVDDWAEVIDRYLEQPIVKDDEPHRREVHCPREARVSVIAQHNDSTDPPTERADQPQL